MAATAWVQAKMATAMVGLAAAGMFGPMAAGVLGKNPPMPLKPNALEQSIIWDGMDDDGQAAAGGPFRVRVALGLGVQYDKVVLSNLYSLRGINAVAVDRDGTLYLQVGTGMAGWGGAQVLAFNRDGTYKRMLTPFPDDLMMDQVKAFGAFDLDGRPAPLVHNPQRLNFYPVDHGPRKLVMGMTREGVILKLAGTGSRGEPLRLVALGRDGSSPWGAFAGPALDEKPGLRSFIVAAADARSAFVSGLTKPAVYRVALPGRGPLTPFFGDPAKPALDHTHLVGAPYGLALDGRGRLLIADNAGDRVVVVSETDGAFVTAIPVERPTAEDQARAGAGRNPKGTTAHGPDCLAVDPRTGAVYLTRLLGGGQIELMKLKGVQEPAVIDRVRLANHGNGLYPWLMALDPGAERPILWLASDGGRLLRIEDLGQRFGEPMEISNDRMPDTNFLDLSVDRVRGEVYLRGCGSRYYQNYWWHRYSEATDTVSRVDVAPLAFNSGAQLVAGPDGHLYCPGYVDGLHKFDRDGKPAAWEKPRRPVDAEKEVRGRTLPAHVTFMPVSECWMKHVLGIRRDGRIFVFEPARNGGRPPRMLREYLPTGQLAREDPIIWKVSDGCVGPKFDPQGNIYIADIVKPVDAAYPAVFERLFGAVKLNADQKDNSPQDNTANMYGSILKFTPKGGMIHYPDEVRIAGVGERPYLGEPKLAPSLKTVDAAYYAAGRLRPVRVTGAEWIHPGYNHVEVRACTCESTRFDVDDFGRVWYPDLGRFRVEVLDSNGNDLTHFGRYGNADAKDAIAFSWLTGVGVSERYVYTSDELNRRLLRLKMTHAAEETCEVRP